MVVFACTCSHKAGIRTSHTNQITTVPSTSMKVQRCVQCTQMTRCSSISVTNKCFLKLTKAKDTSEVILDLELYVQWNTECSKRWNTDWLKLCCVHIAVLVVQVQKAHSMQVHFCSHRCIAPYSGVTLNLQRHVRTIWRICNGLQHNSYACYRIKSDIIILWDKAYCLDASFITSQPPNKILKWCATRHFAITVKLVVSPFTNA